MSEPIRITVKYLGAFSDAVQSKEETCEIASPLLSALLDHLIERHGEKFRSLAIDCSTNGLRAGMALLVNGHRREMQHQLSDGDEITLLTPVAGGSDNFNALLKNPSERKQDSVSGISVTYR